MYYFDPHIHMVSRTTDDYATLTRMGCVGLSEPAFWAGFDRGSVDSFRDYFKQLTDFEERRASQYGIRHYTWMCINAKEAENVSLARDVIKRMARLSDISFAERAPEGAVQLLVRGEVAALPLKGVIDLAAERARLNKEIAKADADIKRVDAKLSNEKFVANAPEEVVEEEKEKREAAIARRAKIVEALQRLQDVNA